MAAALGAEIFSRGFRFTPSPLEVVTYYLPRLVAGAPLHEAVRPVVHHAEVYACEPGELARRFCPLPRTGHRFFFTYCKLQQPHKAGKASRAARAAGPGSWHSQAVADIVDMEKVKVGEIRKLRYKKGGAYTDWLMDEYSCCLEEAVVDDRQYVFCNIYVSPRSAKDSAARQESAAFYAPHAPAPAPVVIAQAAAPKRPAPQSAEPPWPKRVRGAVGPTPPVVQPASCMTSFAPKRPCVPNHRGVAPSSTPSVTRSSPASAQPPAPVLTHLAVQSGRSPAYAPPLPLAQPKQEMPSATPSVVRACHIPQQARTQSLPPQPRVPQRGMGMATASSTSSVTPLRPRSPPKQQMPPPPTPPVVRASQMPVVQAPASPFRSLPSVQRMQSVCDPFEAARLRDEAEEERVAAPDPKEPPAAEQDDDLDDLIKAIEDNVPTCDGSTMTEDEMEQLLFPDAIA